MPAAGGQREVVVLVSVAGSGGSDHALHLCCYLTGPPGTLWETRITDADFVAHVRGASCGGAPGGGDGGGGRGGRRFWCLVESEPSRTHIHTPHTQCTHTPARTPSPLHCCTSLSGPCLDVAQIRDVGFSTKPDAFIKLFFDALEGSASAQVDDGDDVLLLNLRSLMQDGGGMVGHHAHAVHL